MPNQPRVSDFTYVSSWEDMVCVALRHGHSDQWRSHGSIIDVFARKIIGWRVSRSMTTVRDHNRTDGVLIAHLSYSPLAGQDLA